MRHITERNGTKETMQWKSQTTRCGSLAESSTWPKLHLYIIMTTFRLSDGVGAREPLECMADFNCGDLDQKRLSA